MGDIADDLIDRAMEEMAYDINIPKVIKSMDKKYKQGKLKWKTKEGKRILIEDMTDTHISNTIKYIERVKEDYDTIANKWIDILTRELKKRST